MGKKIKVLFQGDSITDCGRPYELEGKSYCESLGNGYVKILAGRLQVDFPEINWEILNRGISGNKVTQLYGRWQTDALNLKPDYLSILVGVNDAWHGLPHPDRDFDGVPTNHYENTYRTLLEYTREVFPEVKYILGQPFLLKGSMWSEEFQSDVEERQAIVRKLAEEFGAACIDYQAAFDRALESIPGNSLSGDGVHTTNVGNTVMADAWMAAFKTII